MEHMGIMIEITWTNKDENSVIEITNLKSGNYLLRRIVQVIASGGSATTHAPTLSTTSTFGSTTVTEIVKESSSPVGTKIDKTYSTPILFHVDGGTTGIGSIFFKPGLDTAASGNDDGTTLIGLEYIGGGKRTVTA